MTYPMRRFRVIILLTACLLCICGLMWLMTLSVDKVQAKVDGSNVRAPDNIHASQVFTDAYEPNDTLPGVGIGSNYGPGISCSNPTVTVQNASLYKFAGIDQDYYNFSVVGSVVYTISIVPQNVSAPSPINFNLVIQNPSGVQVAASTANAPSASFFVPIVGGSPDGGNYRIYIQAQNPNFDPRDQAYNVTLCSSQNLVTVTPAATPTAFGTGPDPLEPNDNPSEVLSRAGGPVSYINVGSQIVNVNFFPFGNRSPITVTGDQGDIDWYFFYGKKYVALGGTGGCYQIQTNIQPGVDTDISVYLDPPTIPMAHNDDVVPLNRSSLLNVALTVNGRYWIKVQNLDSSPRGAGQTYNISLLENSPTSFGCTVLYSLRAYLPIQIAPMARNILATATPSAVTATPSSNQLGPVIVTGSVAITNVNAAAGTAFDEYADIFNVSNSAVTLVDWKIRVGGQVYNLSNPPGTQIQLLPQQGCRVYTGTNVGPVALPGEYNACGAKFLGVTSGTKIYPNTTGYQIELLNESNVVVAYFGR